MQCPHCLQHFFPEWQENAVRMLDGEPNERCIRDAANNEGIFVTRGVKCPACFGITVALGIRRNPLPKDDPERYKELWVVYPQRTSRSPLPAEVPKEFAVDYLEACLVLQYSEKASAALSRRCLQHLLHDFLNIKDRDLATEIEKLLDSNKLPSGLAGEVDAVRHIGNFAAHPIKSSHTGEIVDVEPHEADWVLTVLEGLFDFYFVQPAKSKARRDALNAKLQEAGKREMKQP